jgi:hypothetical protein
MLRTRRMRVPRDAGVALIDVMIGLTLLAFVTAALMNIFLFATAQARSSGIRGEAGAWVQGEIDYLRLQGYSGPACLAAGPAKTITPGSTLCGAAPEPPLPASFNKATIQVEDWGATLTPPRSGLKRITIEVYRVPGNVLYRVVTYATSFT